MHPKNQMLIGNSFFDWIKDYGPSKSRHGGKGYMKRECRRTVRRDGKDFLRQEAA